MDSEQKIIIGWNEWCGLPLLHLPAIKAKIDTGAKTSALHAFNIKRVRRNKQDFIEFNIHPLQGNKKLTKTCHAQIVDCRKIMSSNGHKETRFIILTDVVMGELTWQIEISLSNRDPLSYRMLIGRDALENFIIDPSHNLLLGKVTASTLKKLYSPIT